MPSPEHEMGMPWPSYKCVSLMTNRLANAFSALTLQAFDTLLSHRGKAATTAGGLDGHASLQPAGRGHASQQSQGAALSKA